MTVDARADHGTVDLTARLTSLVRRIDPAFDGIVNLSRVSAGASLETWRFDAVGAGSAIPLILRRFPGFRTAVGRSLDEEASLLQRLHGSVPVPKVRHVLDTADDLGEGFVMERIDGETIPQRILREPALERARSCLVGQLAGALAAIHAFDATDLAAMPVERTSIRLEALARDVTALDTPRPVLELAVRWLRDRLPEWREPRLVHGDYRNGNIIVDSDGLAAVLDWEAAHLGDPAEDLGWLMLPPWRFGFLDRPVGGLGSAAEFIDAYSAASGRAVDPARILWWQAFGSLRWGTVCAQMVGLVTSGRDRSPQRAMIARRASESELDLMRLITGRS